MPIISNPISKIKSFFKYFFFLFGIPLFLFIWNKTYIYRFKNKEELNFIEKIFDWVLFYFVELFVLINVIFLIIYATIRLFKKIKHHQKFLSPLFAIIISNLILNIIIVDIKYDMIEKKREQTRICDVDFYK